MSTDKLILQCSNGFTLRTDGENIVVATKKTEEVIPISSIQRFSIKEPGLIYGKIVFQTAQSATMGVNVGFGISAALGAERTFFYLKGDFDKAKQLRDIVMNYSSPSSNSQSFSVSTADEIRKLKGLLDDGIITQEEFEAKKKQFLGL